MSRASLAATKAEILALLAPGGVNLAGVTATYDHEPYAGQALRPVWVTISTTAVRPTEWEVAVRVYQAGDTIPAKTAQDTLDTLVALADTALRATGRYGPSNWELSWNEPLNALVAESVLVVGREDGWDR